MLMPLMLIAARHLVDRMRHPKSRADEVLAVRRRLVAQPAASQVSEEQIALAGELRRLREELSAALGGVASCSGCARGHSLPHGRWNGGQCCGGSTENIFTDDELGALRLSGTTPARLAPPHADHSGGCGRCSGFGSTSRGGILKWFPSYDTVSWVQMRGSTSANSCHMPRVSPRSDPYGVSW